MLLSNEAYQTMRVSGISVEMNRNGNISFFSFFSVINPVTLVTTDTRRRVVRLCYSKSLCVRLQ